jgi:NADH dehydrogenase
MPLSVPVDTSLRPRVVIVGAGFGGLAATRGLRRSPVDVTVIDRTNHHLFAPLLYQVAAGLLSPGEIAPALRKVLRRQHNASVLLGEATEVDLDAQQVGVHQEDGTTSREGYDYLVLAAGAHDSYFGHDDWAEHAYPMKTLAEAAHLRDHIFAAYERAADCANAAERYRLMSFVIVGAGPTGVEIAGQLAALAHEMRQEFHPITTAESRIVLIDALPHLLGTFPAVLRNHAGERLAALGVDVRLDTRAEAIDADGITIKTTGHDTQRIDAHTVIWAAGVQPSPLAEAIARKAGAHLDRKRRVYVGPDCSLPGQPNVFVIGDMANLHDLPGLSEPAIQEGRYVAKAIRQRVAGMSGPSPFTYRDLGTMATISPTDAVADVFGLRLRGRVGKLAWAMVHIAFLVGWGNRIGVLVRWAFLLLTKCRPERVIRNVAHYGADAAAAGREREAGQLMTEPARPTWRPNALP